MLIYNKYKKYFKRENFYIKKNTEIVFYSFKQFRYLSMHIVGNGNSVEVFRLFSMYLKDKAFKHLMMTENPATKITMSHI